MGGGRAGVRVRVGWAVRGELVQNLFFGNDSGVFPMAMKKMLPRYIVCSVLKLWKLLSSIYDLH